MIRYGEKKEVNRLLETFSDQDWLNFQHDWYIWARDNQIPPDVMSSKVNKWLILAGRGWGKTRTGAEYVKDLVDDGYKNIAFVAPTPADARDVMVEGQSGILNIYPKDKRPVYEPSKRRVTFHNGAIAIIYSGYKPDQLRGPQHDAFWADEMAAWRYVQETWDMLMFGLRIGDPRGVITTTPRPIPAIKDLIKDPSVVVTKGSTYENRENLADAFFSSIISKYEGTRLGRQELNAEILDDNPNALWTRGNLEDNRVNEIPDLVRIVVAVDPNASDNENSDEVGIIVAGVDREGLGYVLEDLSCKGSPKDWASMAIGAYYKYKADRIVAEINQGGNMVEYVVKSIDTRVAYKGVHAAKGKYTRAEPVSALYEQNKVKHIGNLSALEDELCEWEQGMASPNRLDALVWAMTELMLGGKQGYRTMKRNLIGI